MGHLRKLAHFFLVMKTCSIYKFEQLYVDNILKLHGVPVKIILDRGSQFTSSFFKRLQVAYGTELWYCTTFHP